MRLARLWLAVPLPLVLLVAAGAAMTASSGEVTFEHGGTGGGAFFCLGLVGSLYMLAAAIHATRR